MEKIKGPTGLQHFFCWLGGYNTFIVAYCPTMYNSFSGIGYLILLGMLTVPVSSYVLLVNVFGMDYNRAILSSIIIGVVTLILSKLMSSLLHKFNNVNVLAAMGLIWFIYSLLISYGLCFGIFHSEITMYTLFNDKTNLLQDRLLVLFKLGEVTNGGGSVLAICSCIIILIAFLIIAPYLLIYYYRNSIYYKTFLIYVNEFSKE